MKPTKDWPGWSAVNLLFEVRDMDPEANQAEAYVKNFRNDFEKISDFPPELARRVASDMLFVHRKLFTPTRWLRQLCIETASRRTVGDFDFKDIAPQSPGSLLEQWSESAPDARAMLQVLRNFEVHPLELEWNGFVRLVNFVAERLAGNPRHIDDISRFVVRAYLRLPEDIADVTDTCRRAQVQASKILQNRVLERVHSKLDGIALLVSDPDGAGVSKLSSEFRRLSRPDLALAATADYGLSEPRGEAVWTSRAAAHADLEEFGAGLELCKAVWAKSPSHYVCTVRSRIHRHMRQNDESHRWAKEGWSLEETKETAQTLAASSVLVHDYVSLAAAAQFLGFVGKTDDDSAIDPYIVVRAGWFLQREGNADAALGVAEQVLRGFPDYPPAVQLRRAAQAKISK